MFPFSEIEHKLKDLQLEDSLVDSSAFCSDLGLGQLGDGWWARRQLGNHFLDHEAEDHFVEFFRMFKMKLIAEETLLN